jgi:hypothetical protein
MLMGFGEEGGEKALESGTRAILTKPRSQQVGMGWVGNADCTITFGRLWVQGGTARHSLAAFGWGW